MEADLNEIVLINKLQNLNILKKGNIIINRDF